MSIALIILGSLLILLGLIGSVAPVLPGPIISFLGLLLLEWSAPIDFSTQLIIIMAIATVIAALTDYFLPILTTKKSGGSKLGTRGSTLGIVLGLFILPPRGLIVFPLLGAFGGELIAKKDGKLARKASYNTFLGSVGSTIIKLIVAGLMLWYAAKAVLVLF